MLRARPPRRAFSGGGHARHLCRSCAGLGKEELAVRQALRDMERAVDRDGRIPRRQRAVVTSFLTHEDARVREHALRLLDADGRWRDERRRLFEEDERAAEAMLAALGLPEDDPGDDGEAPDLGPGGDLDVLPF